MGLNIRDPEADRLARELAATTGESVPDAVLRALRERLSREALRGRTSREKEKAGESQLRDKLRAIRKRCAALPVLDDRTPEEIVGYDDRGLPR
jgi:antitoxin VapB